MKALVLSGGGAKGAFQVGVLETLLEKGYKPDAIYGTSVGALNACALSFRGIDYTKNIWLNIKDRGDILSLKWNFLWADGLFSMAPLRAKIQDACLGKPLDSPTCEAIVCLTKLSTGEVLYISNKIKDRSTFAWAVEGSAAIPFFMEPVSGDWVDGGVREQAPLRKAIEDGATEIKVILCNPVMQDMMDEWKPKFPKTLNNGLRALDIMEHEVFLNDIKQCAKVNTMVRFGVADIPRMTAQKYREVKIECYAPDRQLYDTLEFDPQKIRDAIIHGHHAEPFSLQSASFQ